ncbi:MAG: T9SS type A sorting domain-containing protein [Aureispira sp.]
MEPNHIVSAKGIITVGGSFQQELHGQQAKGGSDLFFYQYNTQQQLLGKYYVRGQQQEQLAALVALPNGGWYGVGSFSDRLFFGDNEATLYQNSTGVFVGKWQTNGQLDWVRQLPNTGFVQVWDAIKDLSGALYLTGQFQDTLFLDQLPPLIAPCATAPFVLKINAQGKIVWGTTSSNCQEARGKSLAINTNNTLFWAGEFKGNFQLKASFKKANNVYRDLFLATINTHTGQVLNQKQFSGVYDNECTHLAYYNQQLYWAGRFSGYLQLDSCWLKTGFKTFGNAFVAVLDSNLQTQWATQSTAFADAYSTGMAIDSQKIILTGYYLDSLEWGRFRAGSQHKAELFEVQLNHQGQVTGLMTGQGGGFDVARGVALDALSNKWLIGGFQDSIELDDTYTSMAKGNSDGFIWCQKTPLTASNSPLATKPTLIFSTIKLSPQPAHKNCIITVVDGGTFERWELYNTSGQLVQKGNSTIIPTQTLSQKVYSLHVITSKGLGIEKLIVK